jgi:hypothetical protein
MLKTTVHDGPQQLGLEQEVLEAGTTVVKRKASGGGRDA